VAKIHECKNHEKLIIIKYSLMRHIKIRKYCIALNPGINPISTLLENLALVSSILTAYFGWILFQSLQYPSPQYVWTDLELHLELGRLPVQ